MIVLFAVAPGAQAPVPPASTQTFEVASIKPRTDGGSDPAPTSPDRFTRSSTTLRSLLRDAYGLPNIRIVGGPDWMGSTRYDVAAKAGYVPSAEQMRFLVRRLLADRFALEAHVETRRHSRRRPIDLS